MDEHVYLGVWTNWSRGHILSATLTTTKGQANLLIAFIASFIAFVASRLSRVVCLAFHRYLSIQQSRTSTLYQHRHIVLCNSTTPESGLLSLLHLLWAWRRSSTKDFSLFASLAFVAFFLEVTFIVAASFSSAISTAIGDEVLLKSVNCGIPWDGPSATRSIETEVVQNRYTAEYLNDAANYAQQCCKKTAASPGT